MSRTDSYHQMLAAMSHIQQNVSQILEAKAVEAARSSQWIVNHLGEVHFDNHDNQVKKTLDIHEQLIEVIDGLTKMEQAIAKNLSVLIGGTDDEEMPQGEGGFGDLFSFGGGKK